MYLKVTLVEFPSHFQVQWQKWGGKSIVHEDVNEILAIDMYKLNLKGVKVLQRKQENLYMMFNIVQKFPVKWKIMKYIKVLTIIFFTKGHKQEN